MSVILPGGTDTPKTSWKAKMNGLIMIHPDVLSNTLVGESHIQMNNKRCIFSTPDFMNCIRPTVVSIDTSILVGTP